MTLDLTDIEQKAKAATPGEWSADRMDDGTVWRRASLRAIAGAGK